MDRVPHSNFDYLRWKWSRLPHATRRLWKGAAAGLLLLWLLGAFVAARNVVDLAAMAPAPRLFFSALVGPGGLVLHWLAWQELYQPSGSRATLLWYGVIALNAVLAFFAGKLVFAPAGTAERNDYQQQRHREEQGRLEGEEILARVPTERGVPLARVGEGQVVSLPYQGGEGHMLVVAPTRAGKSLHLTASLLAWPGPVICLDPKSEQWQRTAGVRQSLGPVYCLPGYSLPLSDYYDLSDGDDLAELHFHLLKPWQSREPIFANKSKPLLGALGVYAATHGLDGVRAMLDAAAGDPVAVLRALEKVALREVRQFTNGLKAEEFVHDRFATSAYGTFTTQLSDYQKHVDTIAPLDGRPLIPRDWAARNGTLYINYSLNDLRGVSGVVAAILAALMRHQLQQGTGQRLLVAIDEFPAVELANANTYLSTVGGAGVTLLLYVQNLAQLRALYGPDGAQALIGNCKHQIWYASADPETARFVSNLYGTTLIPAETRTLSQDLGRETPRLQQGVSERLERQPALPPAAVMSLPKEQVVVQTEADRLYRFLGERLNPLHIFDQLPPPPRRPAPPDPKKRVYPGWDRGSAAAAGRSDPVAESAPAEETGQMENVTAGTDPEADVAPQIPSGEAPAGDESAPPPTPPAPEEAASPPEDPVADEPPAPPIDLSNFFGTPSDKGD